MLSAIFNVMLGAINTVVAISCALLGLAASGILVYIAPALRGASLTRQRFYVAAGGIRRGDDPHRGGDHERAAQPRRPVLRARHARRGAQAAHLHPGAGSLHRRRRMRQPAALPRFGTRQRALLLRPRRRRRRLPAGHRAARPARRPGRHPGVDRPGGGVDRVARRDPRRRAAVAAGARRARRRRAGRRHDRAAADQTLQHARAGQSSALRRLQRRRGSARVPALGGRCLDHRAQRRGAAAVGEFQGLGREPALPGARSRR